MTTFELAEFVAAQNRVYDQVLRELTAGRKKTHWMWFIFPQIIGLGSSGMSQMFGIDSLAEAQSYLRDDVLGSRLRKCTELMLASPHQDISAILEYPDDFKFRSSMTLFAVAAPGDIFEAALEKFFGGERDALTISRLREDAPMPKLISDVATRTSWKTLPLPEARTALDFNASYSGDDFERIRRGLIPRQMEDKWFIFYEEPWLYLHRSWTGRGIYGVRFQSEGSMVTAVESWVCRDSSYKSTSAEYDLAILTFLIEGILLGRPMRFPVPGDLPPSAPSGLFQHGVIGRGYPEKRFEAGGADDKAS